MSRFQGREIDDIGLWSKYIDIPMGAEKEPQYWPKVACPNPNHDTTKRHFQVNVESGLVHCFAHCGISGNYLHALCTIHGYYDEFNVLTAGNKQEKQRRLNRAYRKARKEILSHAGTGKRKGKVVRRIAGADGNSIPTESLSFETFIPQAGLEYLSARGITAASISRFGLGWCPETLRVVIPGRDLRGETRFLIKRGVRESQQPKYLYTEGFPKTSLLFGACETDLQLIRSQGIIIVEGSLDTICVDQWNALPVVGQLGTGISNRQIEILSQLRPRRIYFMFDKDAAGIQSIQIAERRLRGKYPVFIMRYPKGKSDPAELTREEGVRSLERAIPLRNFNRRVERKVRSFG